MTHRLARLTTAAVAIAVSLVAMSGGGATRAGARATPVPTAPVVKVTVAHRAITFHSGTRLHPGAKIFDVTAKGPQVHTLQILRLHKGYSFKQLRNDIHNGIDQGNPRAMRRLDRRVTWLGGARSEKHKTAEFGVTLRAGRYYAIDTHGPASAKLKVAGATQVGAIPTAATVTGTSNDRWTSPKALPANGWIRLRNTSNEAHFLTVQQVRPSTTAKDVRKYVKSGSTKKPPWVRHRPTATGVFSRHTKVEFHLHRPAGKYLLACFWNSDKTGTPHFQMGMWKLVNLK